MRLSGRTLLIVIVLGGILYWGVFLGGFSMFGGQQGDVTLQLQTNNALDETVFSPAGASVKVWDTATGEYLGPMTEDSTYDGKWASAYAVPVGTRVSIMVADSGSTFYTNVVERMITAGAAGVDRICVLQPVLMMPRSATSASDLVGTFMTAGVEVDNSTDIASGETDILVSLTAASGKGWGGIPYRNYETGDDYLGAFMVWDLTTTTGRMTLTCPNLYAHFSLGSHEYWVIQLPQIVNDADIDDDGTYTFTIHVNNLVAATNAIDVGCYTNAIIEDVMATSFGTSDTGESAAEAWMDIHLA